MSYRRRVPTNCLFELGTVISRGQGSEWNSTPRVSLNLSMYEKVGWSEERPDVVLDSVQNGLLIMTSAIGPFE